MKQPVSSKIRTLAYGLILSCLTLPSYAQEQQDTTADHAWFDQWLLNFESAMDDTAQDLDAFFALSGDRSHEDARASGRIRLGWEPRSRDFAEFDVRFRVRVKLPALQNRVDLLLTDDEDDLDENSVKAARNDQLGRRDQTTLSLRFRRTPDAKLSHRIGFGRRDQIFVKSRYRDGYVLDAENTLFYDAELYYYNRDRLGGELGLTYQHIVDEESLWRLNNRYYYRDISNDWRWRHEAQWLTQVTNDSAFIYTLFVEGLSRPNMHTEQVFLSARWRTNPTRKWLYYEVEPFVLWLKEEDFKPSYGIALRLEVFYGKI
ncbi:hypothetical protein [Alteromonas facilis]|uniref:hypothetical protein n=1 Tax=Alteromonas facilis TaxID=2048004 RepID=UPI000C288349|nr:hypothetical protein [Alteromonas facilis]